MKFIIRAIPDEPLRDCWVCSITDDDFKVSVHKGKALHFEAENIDSTIRRLSKIQAGYGLFAFQAEPAPQLEIPEPPAEPFRFDKEKRYRLTDLGRRIAESICPICLDTGSTPSGRCSCQPSP